MADTVMMSNPFAESAAAPAPAGSSASHQPPHPRRTAAEMEDSLPMRWRELLAILVIVVLSDLTIYRGQGFAGYAALFLASPVLLAWGAFKPRFGPAAWFVGTLVAVIAAKAIWC
ncbi:MAG TPA: hypothetical protein VN699_19395, partial [Pirellulales bacterium]|nr:hypothetical protein [Pirellulales bacterium]